MRALVLGGGGVAGIAWEVGILHGLGETVLDVDMIVGTSAGSVVAAALGHITPEEAYQRQTTPSPASANNAIGPAPKLDKLLELFAKAYSLPPEEAVPMVADLSLSADTMPEEAFVKVIGGNLPSNEWPDRDISVVAYDTGSAQRTVFTRESGVDLGLAVAASCSVPGVFPPVTINGNRYMDGGIRMSNNADLVAGYDEVLIIAPMTELAPPPNAKVITPDREAFEAMGGNVLDPASRIPSAQAGLRQGRSLRPH
ncbi:patatin-like phospholipase family protein [Kibdelosporangium philippinense]|uniref:Patatin-like phospholipase family protein n=1 Tax=Kibdelosporangium philippinense TaxID=211113 RepID=A0ABS8ZMV9_9PSEU|nr:patatin-like phospholipase family protein [Kibdelosporangium philippinense]MCE7009089.1 patatin-like phospholipase family protein [Kibdelosporangium philippinense]